MSFFDTLLKRDSGRTRSALLPFNIDLWNYRSAGKNVLETDVIRASIDALARNIAKMELQSVIKRGDAPAVIDNRSDIAKVLQKPNPYMSMYDFLYKVAALYYSTNNVFIWVDTDDMGNILALYPINYETFHLYKTESGILVAQFQLSYFNTYTVPYSKLIHLRNHFISDDLFGDSNAPIDPIRELTNAQNQGIINGIKNSAVIRGILKSLNVIKREDLERAKEQFVEDNLKASNTGGVIAIDGKFDYQNIESKPYIIDPATMAETKKKVFDYFGVNEAFLQNSFTAEQYEAVYEGRLEPFAIMLTAAMTGALFTDRERAYGNKIEVSMARVKYQQMSTVTQMIMATNQLGLFTRNEYREMLGYAPLTDEQGGNDIMIAVNNYTADGSGGIDNGSEE